MKVHAKDIILGPQFPNSFMSNRKLHSNLQTRENPRNTCLTGRNKPTKGLSGPYTFNTLNYLTTQHSLCYYLHVLQLCVVS